MGLFENLINNGEKCGIKYEFIDNYKLKDCKCGGKPQIYIKHTKKKFSFEHGSICCPKCKKLLQFNFDITGKDTQFFKRKETVIKNAVDEWNNAKWREENGRFSFFKSQHASNGCGKST